MCIYLYRDSPDVCVCVKATLNMEGAHLPQAGDTKGDKLFTFTHIYIETYIHTYINRWIDR